MFGWWCISSDNNIWDLEYSNLSSGSEVVRGYKMTDMASSGGFFSSSCGGTGGGHHSLWDRSCFRHFSTGFRDEVVWGRNKITTNLIITISSRRGLFMVSSFGTSVARREHLKLKLIERGHKRVKIYNLLN